MKLRLGLLLTVVCFCASVQARLGWTRERMETNYGQGAVNSKGEIEYRKQGFTVCALYSKDRVVFIRYETGDDETRSTTTFTGERTGENSYRDLGVVTTYEKFKLSDEQIDEFMQINGRKHEWRFRGKRKIQAREAEMGFDFDESYVQEYVLDGGEARAFYTAQRTKLAFVMDDHMNRLGKYRNANMAKDNDGAGIADGF